jgi:hypothetical protein
VWSVFGSLARVRQIIVFWKDLLVDDRVDVVGYFFYTRPPPNAADEKHNEDDMEGNNEWNCDLRDLF